MRSQHASLLLAAAAAGATAQLVMPWTTDLGSQIPDEIGPDGPWQAVAVVAGGTWQALWPGGSSATNLVTKKLNGTYTPSASARKTGSRRGAADTWLSSVFMGAGFFGFEYYDNVTMQPRLGSSRDMVVNATVIAADEWSVDGNGTSVAPTVGILGLGPNDSRNNNNNNNNDKPGAGILDQLKASKSIERSAFGLHMGSAALNLSGSLVLGGYEKNRALGDVGTFTMQDGIPQVFLLDVTMGTETGSPSKFPKSPTGSFWTGNLTETGSSYAKMFGGAAGSAMVIPNPASPYIYLPAGVCEGVAANLGLTYHEPTGLYLWQSSRDGSVQDFINSPSYLGFVLSDKTATNITVKVPFKLLDLTLRPPLAEQAVQYFPCKSSDAPYGVWQLGRAFLQAAFLGVDYDGNAMYIAQAPGPGLEQSVVERFDGSAAKTNAASSFGSSWEKSWAVSASTDGSVREKLVAQDKGLSAGGIAGIAVAAVVVVIAALWLLRRHRKKKQGPGAPPDAIDRMVYWLSGRKGEAQRTKAASDTDSNVAVSRPGTQSNARAGPEAEMVHHGHELDSTARPAEMEASGVRGAATDTSPPVAHEAPNDYVLHELPTGAEGVNRK